MFSITPFLTPDLLNPKWKKLNHGGHPLKGHCYVAAEASFHLLGGAAKGYSSFVLNHRAFPEGLKQGETHWFIKNRLTREVVDPTAAQFSAKIPYGRGIACGFLTKRPSLRTQKLLTRMGLSIG